MDRRLLVQCLLLQTYVGLMTSCVATGERPNFPPAIFAFGDSMIDPGNNNYIDTFSKADFPYNGVDFPSGPTGRFCNGRTVVDVICDIFQVPYLPAYLDPQANGTAILSGVNYGSGAAGILNATGENFRARLSMDQQIAYCKRTLDNLKSQLGKSKTAALVNKSLVIIEIGNNDFINNYFLSTTNTSHLYNPVQFVEVLIDRLSAQLRELYSMGFRRMYVSGIGPLGCIPHELARAQTTECVQTTNDQVVTFNYGLRSLLDQLNGKLTDATFLFGNVYDPLKAFIADPASHGFEVANQGCCGSGLYRGQFPCTIAATVCHNRDQYVFWDPYHTTEAVNVILADGLYDGGPDRTYPMNLHQLVDLP